MSSSSSSSSTDSSINWENQILSNRYIILKKIDSGAYASVWITFDIQNIKYCAIKINNAEDLKTGRRETKMYNVFKKYKSNSIMTMIDSFEHETESGVHHCCVMDLMACSLYNLIKTKKYSRGLQLNVIVNITYQVLKGLSHMHKDNIIHGDIKPENILVCGQSISQKKLFNFVNVNEIISKTKVDIKLDKIKNSNNKNNKNKKHTIHTTNTTNAHNNFIEKIASQINKKMSEYQKHQKETKCSSDKSYDTIENSSDSTNDINSNSDSETSKNLSCKISISSCESDSYVSSKYIYHNDTNDKQNSDNSISSVSSISSVNSNNSKKEILNDDNINNMKVKISDMGGCLLPEKPRRKQIQTCYYRSPEILLGLDYGIECDMWALGCTIYELLTGQILFDPNDFEGNVKRHHVYLITKKIGLIPESMVNKSPKRDIFFTANNKLIKGYKSIDFSNMLPKELEVFMKRNQVDPYIAIHFIDFMKKILFCNPVKRLKVDDALNHPLFSEIQ